MSHADQQTGPRSKLVLRRGVQAPRSTARSTVDWARLDRSLSAFEPESLITLLTAAVNSPGCGHRLPTLSMLWSRAVRNPPTGTSIPTPSNLPQLLDAARQAAPQLLEIEDCWLADPRHVVRFPINGTRFAIHPGPFTNPLQVLRLAMSVAEAVDDFVLQQHGFRLSDLVEAALAYSDCVLGAVRPAWPVGMLPRDEADPEDEDLETRVRRIAGTPVILSETEIEAASICVPTEELLSTCSVPSEAAVAWKWATRSADSLQRAPTRHAPVLGTALSVRTGSTERPIPVALVLEAITAAVIQLCAEAAGDRTARFRMQVVTEKRFSTIFDQQFCGPVDAPVSDNARSIDSHDGPVIVVTPSPRRAFVIGITSGLNVDGLKRSIKKIRDQIGQVDLPAIQTLNGGFDPAGTIHRVIIYGGPCQMPLTTRRGAPVIHVENLVDVVLEGNQTIAGRDVGIDYLWQFLDEYSTKPGVERLLAIDFDDIWRHWLKYGVLNATGHQNVELHPNPVPDERHWIRAAEWEPIEVVLTNAGLAASWEWQFARLDEEPGQATVGFGRQFCQVIADPPLIFGTAFDPTLGDIGIDPAIAHGMVIGIALTILKDPEITSAFTLSKNTAIMCDIAIQGRCMTEATDSAVPVGYASTKEPRPAISILVGLEWLDLLAHDPAAAHGTLGRAFVIALAQITDISNAAQQRFLAAWRSTPPVFLLEARKGALGSVHQGRDQLPRSPASRGRARRALAATILARNVTPGVYQGSEARRVCQEKVLPAANDALRDTLADWSPMAVDTVAKYLNDAFAERVRKETELAMALAAPWAEHWQRFALTDSEPAERTRPLELVLEFLLERRSDGSIQPDRFEIAEAVDLANESLRIGLALAGTASHLHDLSLLVSSGGNIGVMPSSELGRSDKPTNERENLAIDMGAYLGADRADRLRLQLPSDEQYALDFKLTENKNSETEPFVPLTSIKVPGSLLRLDAILKENCGTGFDAISAVLGTALTWTSGGDGVVEVTREELRREAVDWSKLPPSEIDAALDHLILEPAQLQTEELRYWEQERRRYRLATRPLIAYRPGRLILIPWRILATQKVYENYLLDGGLPWHSSEIPQRVQDALVRFRQVQNQSLEREAAAIAAEIGLPHRSRIKEAEAERGGLKIPGEIDLLVADSSRCRLWVCEVKDLSFAVSPSTLANRVGKFLAPKGYVSQLTRAADAVQANLGAAAHLVHAPDPDRDWTVIPLMVTRRVEPAGFAEGLAVSFVVLTDLGATLQQDAVPPLGHIPISGA